MSFCHSRHESECFHNDRRLVRRTIHASQRRVFLFPCHPGYDGNECFEVTSVRRFRNDARIGTNQPGNWGCHQLRSSAAGGKEIYFFPAKKAHASICCISHSVRSSGPNSCSVPCGKLLFRDIKQKTSGIKEKRMFFTFHNFR